MHQIKCPNCGEERFVRAKKPWMKGLPPYIKICKSCCQKGKEKSPETIAKLSEATKRQQTPELLQIKSQFMKDHPEYWQDKLIAGGGGGWNKGLEIGPISEEVKKKISESMRANAKKRKEKQ